jgi:hypothetical protein
MSIIYDNYFILSIDGEFGKLVPYRFLVIGLGSIGIHILILAYGWKLSNAIMDLLLYSFFELEYLVMRWMNPWIFSFGMNPFTGRWSASKLRYSWVAMVVELAGHFRYLVHPWIPTSILLVGKNTSRCTLSKVYYSFWSEVSGIWQLI